MRTHLVLLKNPSIAGHKAMCEVPHKMTLRIAAFALLLAPALFALGPANAQIQQTDKEPYAAPTGQALLVFNRPRRRQASETDFRIVDQAGRCLALLEDGWQVAAPIWPGKHILMLITGTAPPTVQLLEAKLSGGKTYVVQLRTRVNMKSPVEIEVVRRDEQPLLAFPSAIAAKSPFKHDLRKCTEWVSWKRSKIAPKAEMAKRRWDDAAEERRATRTIRRNDGWTAAEIYGP